MRTVSEHSQMKQLYDGVGGAFFSYDIDAFYNHLEKMMSSSRESNEKLKLWYAVKSNPLSAIIKTAARAGFNFDCASLGEVKHVLNCGVEASQILVTGPVRSKNTIQKMLRLGVREFVFESENQLLWSNEIAESENIRLSGLLRLQIDFSEMQERNVLGGKEVTAFGLCEETCRRIEFSSLSNIRLRGFHVFQWGNILDITVLEEIWRSTFQHCQKLNQELGIKFNVLDVGGGLGIPYSRSQESLSWEEVEKVIFSLLQEFELPQLWMEMGRYAVGECGSYIARIEDTKTVRGEKMLLLEGGINHIARPALTSEAFPARLVSEDKNSSESNTLHLHGPLCTSLDSLGSQKFTEHARVGDYIRFSQCGAYGFTESMPFFLCHKLAGEVVIKADKIEILREAVEAESWLR